MKKTIKLIAVFIVACLTVVAFSACKPLVTSTPGVDTVNHTITIGNTAATTGAFAGVGVPFNYGLQAYLWYYTNVKGGYHDAEGNQYSFIFKHYDDGFDAAKGTTYTQNLVEDDKVFALVGHFGSNTVSATVDYIEEQGVPMVYGVCGVPQLYKTERNVMTIQPIYNTEGAAMLATAVATTENNLGLGATKVGVIATTDEAGASIKAGILEEAEKLGLTLNTDLFVYDADAAATEYTSAVEGLKANGCDVVIIAANQAPFIAIANQFVTSNFDNVKIITSYVSANNTTMAGLVAQGVITPTRRVFTGAWLSTGSVPTDTKGWKDFVEYTKVITLYDKANQTALLTSDDATYGALVSYYFGTYDWAIDGVSASFLNSFAMAGVVAGYSFCQGLERVDGQDLTWDSFINAMESAPIDVLMGGAVNYANGHRVGIDALAITEYTQTSLTGEVYRPITALDVIEAGYNN